MRAHRSETFEDSVALEAERLPSLAGHALYAFSYSTFEMRPLPKNMSRSFCSSLGPLQLTFVASPPQHALPSAAPASLSDVLNGACVRIQLAMFGPYWPKYDSPVR